MSDKLKIVAACGVGMGSSLILKMNIEDVLKELKVPATVDHSDISSLIGTNYDIVVVQTFYADQVKNYGKVVVAVDDFLNKDKLKEKLQEAFKTLGVEAQ
ncbi:PTS sugar transporter subunit IIB [Coprothermobacter platensis]|uniref:PTS sugar transporter subunit IIB n=1 Tax=Coprothermobacter platensis TaxID=108819 RepID=UPI0003608292|nr:PTS sugar transporter subunit IIB [Coprothermobacter platensis]